MINSCDNYLDTYRHGHCLVHVESHILGVPLHESRPLSRSMVVLQLHGTSTGRAFKLC